MGGFFRFSNLIWYSFSYIIYIFWIFFKFCNLKLTQVDSKDLSYLYTIGDYHCCYHRDCCYLSYYFFGNDEDVVRITFDHFDDCVRWNHEKMVVVKTLDDLNLTWFLFFYGDFYFFYFDCYCCPSPGFLTFVSDFLFSLCDYFDFVGTICKKK